MLERSLVAFGLIVASIILVSIFGGVASLLLRGAMARRPLPFGFLGQAVALSLSSLWMLIGLSGAVWLWALTLHALGTFPTLEESLYFSMVAFTTLGFGDVLLDQHWRLLSGSLAANGLILFSLATAFLLQILTRLHDHHR